MEGSLVSHSRAKLNAYGRRLLCERIQAGFPVRVAARMVGISHARAYLIWGLYRDIGERAAPRAPLGTDDEVGARRRDRDVAGGPGRVDVPRSTDRSAKERIAVVRAGGEDVDLVVRVIAML